MYDYKEIGVALSESTIYFYPQRPLAELFHLRDKRYVKLMVEPKIKLFTLTQR